MSKTVYLGMIGDIMHPGLINIINEGAKYGDVMIGLYTDKAIATHKRLPYLNYEQRKNVIENIKGVSTIVPQDDWSYVPNLLKYKPNYIIHGDDWVCGPDKYLRDEVFNVMESIGGEVIEIPYTKGISASGLKETIDSLGVTPQARLASLRRLISAKPIVRILESHNGLTGLIAEHTNVEVNGQHREFDGMWASSLTDSTSKGKPDIEAVDLTTRLHDLNDALEVTTKPVIFDGDTGGKVEHFVFTVRTLERLGISAVIIEDKVGLKQNSLFGTDAVQTQDTIEGFCYKIKAGKEAQGSERNCTCGDTRCRRGSRRGRHEGIQRRGLSFKERPDDADNGLRRQLARGGTVGTNAQHDAVWRRPALLDGDGASAGKTAFCC